MSYPSLLEQHHEGRTAYDLVLGAMLGGYLGLTISEHGLSGGTYFDLGILLVFLGLFVLSLNSFADRFHRRFFWAAFKYAALALGTGISSLVTAPKLQVDVGILATILVVWLGFALFECWTAIAAILFKSDEVPTSGTE
jgi:hypothetical protein